MRDEERPEAADQAKDRPRGPDADDQRMPPGAGDRPADSRRQVEQGEADVPVESLDERADPGEHPHVDRQMDQAAVQEDRREQPPDLAVDRHRGADVPPPGGQVGDARAHDRDPRGDHPGEDGQAGGDQDRRDDDPRRGRLHVGLERADLAADPVQGGGLLDHLADLGPGAVQGGRGRGAGEVARLPGPGEGREDPGQGFGRPGIARRAERDPPTVAEVERRFEPSRDLDRRGQLVDRAGGAGAGRSSRIRPVNPFRGDRAARAGAGRS